jgi:uncharacterized membrane protein YccC
VPLIVVIWLVCVAIAVLISLFARTPTRVFAIASITSFVVVYFALLYVGHPIDGVSLFDVVLAAIVTAGAAALAPKVTRRAKGS